MEMESHPLVKTPNKRLTDREIVNIPIEEYERIFSVVDEGGVERIPIRERSRLVILYLLAHSEMKTLRDCQLYARMPFESFIETHSKYFYLNGEIEGFMEIIHECAVGNSIVIAGATTETSSPETLLGLYIKRISALCPDIVIDDVIYKYLRRPRSLTSAGIHWLKYIVRYKKLRRQTLRHIFNRVVYLETGWDRSALYGLLSEILTKYEISDRFIKAKELEKKIQEAEMALDLIKEPENQQRVTDSIKAARKEISRLRAVVESEEERDFYDYSLTGDEDLSSDNVFVLTSIIWDDLVHYIRCMTLFTESTHCAMGKLLANMIDKTGIFLRRRLSEIHEILGILSRTTPQLDEAVKGRLGVPDWSEWFKMIESTDRLFEETSQ